MSIKRKVDRQKWESITQKTSYIYIMNIDYLYQGHQLSLELSTTARNMDYWN